MVQIKLCHFPESETLRSKKNKFISVHQNVADRKYFRFKEHIIMLITFDLKFYNLIDVPMKFKCNSLATKSFSLFGLCSK